MRPSVSIANHEHRARKPPFNALCKRRKKKREIWKETCQMNLSSTQTCQSHAVLSVRHMFLSVANYFVSILKIERGNESCYGLHIKSIRNRRQINLFYQWWQLSHTKCSNVNFFLSKLTFILRYTQRVKDLITKNKKSTVF